MKSTGRYVHKRIPTLKGKRAYHSSLKQCIAILNSGITSLDMVKTKIDVIKTEASLVYTTSLWTRNRDDEINHHNLAVEQALEIIEKLEARYINGAFDSEPRGFGHRTETYHYDENLF